MPTDLYFDLTAALRLAEHAVAAPQHRRSFTEDQDGLTCPGALVWAADTGTYLMSSGNPPLLADPDDPTSSIVVHAHGNNIMTVVCNRGSKCPLFQPGIFNEGFGNGRILIAVHHHDL